MIIRNYPIPKEDLPFSENQFPEHALFFDIETTGLSHRTSHLYMIGGIGKIHGRLTFVQWFLQKPSEEKDLLQQFSELLKQFHKVIHYNGRTFDLPYIQERCRYWDLEDPFPPEKEMQSLDLYQELRFLKKTFQLNSIKQKDMEQLVHFPRRDRMSGKELIEVYHHYLQTADGKELDFLLLHNRDDLFGMLPIYGLYLYLASLDSLLTVSEAKIREDQFHLLLHSSYACPANLELQTQDIKISIRENRVSICISGIKGCMKHYFSNYKDYFYLPLEDLAIHKSVGLYVDPSCRQKAKADTCYTKKEGLFFFQPSPVFLPDFRQDTRKGPSYFSLEELEEKPDLLPHYGAELILYLIKQEQCFQ